MKMLVLAGGFGTRLKEVVNDVPKPMAPINGIPLLQLQLDHWIHQGQQKFIFLLHHQSSVIVDSLMIQSKRLGNKVDIEWIIEDKPLGTGGSVLNAITTHGLENSVLIANADTWLDGGIQELKGIDFPVIAAVRVNDTSRYGSILIDSKGRLTEFVEKQSGNKTHNSGIINAGLYKLPTELFLNISRKEFAIETEVLPQLTEKKLLKAKLLEGAFFDIGVPQDYYKFCDWYKHKKGIRGYT